MTSGEIRDLRAFLDGKFGVIDERLDRMDRRFEAVDQRFEAIDQRFEVLQGKVEQNTVEIRHNGVLIERNHALIQTAAEGVAALNRRFGELEHRMETERHELRELLGISHADLDRRVIVLEEWKARQQEGGG